MRVVGIVVEYNPFHNGHLYHIEKTREKFENCTLIAIMSGNIVQRGQFSILDKFTKSKLALSYGVDIVLDLPFIYANQSADIFAAKSIEILNHFGVTDIVFGSETNDVKMYKNLADIQLNDKSYDNLVLKYMNQSLNYPTACSKALEDICGKNISLPNDILGLSYTKAILKNNYNIDIHTIKRTNDFHSNKLDNVASATGIRNALLENKDVEHCVPPLTFAALNSSYLYFNENFFNLLKYKILSSTKDELNNINLVTEGIENRIISVIKDVNSYDELVKSLSTKRYTYARVSRILINILFNVTKYEAQKALSETYYRVLGFNETGQMYLSKIKSSCNFLTTIKNQNLSVCKLEYRVASIYNMFNTDYAENRKVVTVK